MVFTTIDARESQGRWWKISARYRSLSIGRAVLCSGPGCSLVASILVTDWRGFSDAIALQVCSGLIPAAHWLIAVATNNERQLIAPRIVGFFVRMALGLGFYLSRWPECRWPGRFDFVGCSHQLWHFFVSYAALYWWQTLQDYWAYVEEHTECG